MAVSFEFMTTRPALSIVPFTEARTQQRIDDDRTERLHRLADRPEHAGVQLEPDTLQAGQFVASARPGYCELVTPNDCSSHQFRM